MPTSNNAASEQEAPDPSLSWTSIPSGSFYFDVAVANSNVLTFTGTTGLSRTAVDSTQNGFSASSISSYTTGVSGNFDAGFDTTRTDDTSISGVYVTAIPEPGTFALFAGALGLCLVLLRRRRA